MTTRLPALTLAIDGRPSPHRVVAVKGREALSSLFELEVTVAIDDPHLADVDAIGARASLTMTRGERRRTVAGIVRTFEQGESAEAPAIFRATLAPRAYVLALREDCRIFQNRTAPQILGAVLEAAGLAGNDYRFVLHGDYRPREHTVQYRESDWTFVLRLMETEGIYSFFEHEGDREVLVFADTPLAHRKMDAPTGLALRLGDGALRGDERASRFRLVRELRAGDVSVRGHDFRAPGAEVVGRANDLQGAPTIHDAPPELDAADLGARFARLRLEQEIAGGSIAHGASDCLGLRPGALFDLREHDQEPLNRAWLVQSVEHRFLAPELEGAAPSDDRPTYENVFTAIPSDVVYRSKIRTPRPAAGIQTAVVVGPAGQEIHCDELGRVKVQFFWDRAGAGDDRSSSWIRVSQSWAGGGYGALFVPRVGQEVLVDFAGGDVDRPIIVGSVYNAANLPPLALPEERTAAILRATSTPGGEGRSELRIEAASGRERVDLLSHRDLALRAGQDRTEQVVRHASSSVGGNRSRTVGGAENVRVDLDRTVKVGGSRTTQIGGEDTTSVGGDQEIKIGGDRALAVGGQVTEVIGEHLKVKVGGNKSENVIGTSREAVAGEKALEAERYSLDVHERMRTDVAGDHLERAGGARRIEAGEIVELVCGEATITANADGSITLVGKNVRVKVAGPVEVEGDRLSIKTAGAVNVAAGGSVKVRGKGVSLN